MVATLCLYGMQDMADFSSPRAITQYITFEKLKASDLMYSQPADGLLNFCCSMEGLYHTAGPQLNYIHVSAIITASAKVWKLAHSNRNFQHSDFQLRSSLQAVFQHGLNHLKPSMQSMGAQEISNILCSSALVSASTLTSMCRT